MPTDPLLSTPAYLAARAHWRRVATHCARCGIQLDKTIGSRSPRAIQTGHIVGRHEARKLGWSDAQINALSNTRPECRTCNLSAGARYGNSVRVRRRRTSRAWQGMQPRTSKAWG